MSTLALVAEAGKLRPDIRLAQAVSEFEADLSAEQKLAFRSSKSSSPPDPSDVMRLAAELDLAGTDRGGRCCGPRVTNILQAVQQFAALGDIIIGGSQNLIACGVWSLVRMALLVGLPAGAGSDLLPLAFHDMAVNLTSFWEKLSMLLMAVGQSAPRYQNMALLYPRSKLLPSYLSEYYIVVVKLCHQLLRFTKKSRIGQIVSPLSEPDLKSYQSDCERYANLIKDEVQFLMAQRVEESGIRVKALSAFSQAETYRKRLKKYYRILNSISTYDHQTTWKETRRVGRATAFKEVDKYREWKSRNASCTFVCTGKLGAGKSVLLANMVDDLCLQDEKLPVVYFFCRYDILESLKAHTIIRSLARQLLLTAEHRTVAEHFSDTSSLALDFDGIVRLLRHALPPKYRAYFVLDGLDDCNEQQKEQVLHQLRELQNLTSLLVCISFRLEADNILTSSLEGLTDPRLFSIPDDNQDIEDFINLELQKRVESEQLKVGEPILVLEIRDALLKGAQGMFLWVVLQIESLCTAKTDKAIRQTLADLPKSLPETFSRILHRPELDKHYQRRIFELIVAARRPLTAEELREALSVVPGDTNWDSSGLLNDAFSVLGSCGSLVIVDEENSTVKLVHHSVKQFLLDGYQDSTGEIFTVGIASKAMQDVIITYLNYNVFETQLSTTVVPQFAVGTVPSTILRSTLGSSNKVQKLALRLLKSPDQSKLAIGKIIADENSKSSSPPVASQFPFLNYAKSYWLQHCRYISEQEPVIYRLVQKLLQKNASNLNMRDDDGETALLTAIGEEHEAMVRLILDNASVLLTRDNNGASILGRAVLSGNEAIVRILLDTGINVNLLDQDGTSPLMYAFWHGYGTIARLLLGRGAVFDASGREARQELSRAIYQRHEGIAELLLERGVILEPRDTWRVLERAASLGYENIMRLLLDNGTAVNVKDENGQPMLLLAASSGNYALVQLLLERGADIEAQSSFGETALRRAVEYRHKAIVQLLLDWNADIENKYESQLTVLMVATYLGNQTIVRLLIDKGAAIDAKDVRDRTALLIATQIGHQALIRILLDKGAAIEAKTSDGVTALMTAVESRDVAIVQLLLEKGADIEAKDRWGQTALFYAVFYASEKKRDVVISLMTSNPPGYSGLQSTRYGRNDIVRLLVDNGANINAVDESGQTIFTVTNPPVATFTQFHT